MPKQGALPCQLIRQMIEAGCIQGSKDENISPASLDLTLSDEVYRVEGICLPDPGGNGDQTIRSLLTAMGAAKYEASFFTVDEIYLVRLEEKLILPEGVYGYCNPKSSTGRNDVHVRVLSDKVSRYDALTSPDGEAELWVVIIPKSYPVRIPAGITVSQARFFTKDTRFDELMLQLIMLKHKPVWSLGGLPIGYANLKATDRDGSILLTLDLVSSVVGFRALRTRQVMDFSVAKGTYPPEDFFEPISRPKSGFLRLRRGDFYILSTLQAVQVPPEMACEMVPMDERAGEFRSHYAGFIDPGWGYGSCGEVPGRPLTLEVRPFEDLIVRSNQPIAKIRLEWMSEEPTDSYDTKVSSSYCAQNRAWLSKHFKVPIL